MMLFLESKEKKKKVNNRQVINNLNKHLVTLEMDDIDKFNGLYIHLSLLLLIIFLNN